MYVYLGRKKKTEVHGTERKWNKETEQRRTDPPPSITPKEKQQQQQEKKTKKTKDTKNKNEME